MGMYRCESFRYSEFENGREMLISEEELFVPMSLSTLPQLFVQQNNVVFVDVDGSLTNGRVTYFDNGTRARNFSVIDGHGFELLRKNGLYPLVISGEGDTSIVNRMRKLGVDYVLNVKRKTEIVSRYSNKLAFFGDDINDLDAMKLCKYVGCPKSAQTSVIDYVSSQEKMGNGIIVSRDGGNGAFRLFAEWLIDKQKPYLPKITTSNGNSQTWT